MRDKYRQIKDLAPEVTTLIPIEALRAFINGQQDHTSNQAVLTLECGLHRAEGAGGDRL